MGVLLALLLQAGQAIAQSPACTQIRAELAGLGGGVTRDSQRLRTELARVRYAIQQNDCERRGFLFFNNPPPVCAPLRAQAAQLAAQIGQMEGGGSRRAQLLAALDRYGCNGRPEQRGVIYAAPSDPGLFDRLFGDAPPRDGRDIDLDEERPRERLGGRLAICVRTCDGFFFPVNFEGIGARDEYAQVCASLCPGAETQVFYMPLGGDVERAATRDGTPYMSLPTAKKYQSAHDPACFCKQPGQTWASALAGTEDLVEARKGDIVVTQEQAAAMSRPKGLQAAAERRTPRDRKGAIAPAPAEAKPAESKTAESKTAESKTAEEPPPSLPESALPTGGTASSGIGPRVVNQRIVSGQGGVREQKIGADGTRRQVRNVAPELTGKERAIDLRGEARP
ncbi:DUF2865 domain-containing protein [Rhabdaerophilum calidifontis]|uniref:DUF2865 domain-containing protein n=1 Tax=Rhabdaerophilum calidifontis TaxID=2604328 RepID=UPI0012388167|nr:DUF2865 domain-containing protein [Rhabdaerophilum calidifontis]